MQTTLYSLQEVLGPRTYSTKVGEPDCLPPVEVFPPFPVFVHDSRTDDSIRLLSNGSLSHHLLIDNNHGAENGNDTDGITDRTFYPPGMQATMQ